ncbi:CRIB domain-containing protein RIC7-like [Senna tora]|uniref:CRIB domain-containing protein RIC7-like n=1 Tax=Senna tora TaxID=362788 RepID=A0A834SPD6_9FABA|nr:CRIB domain-containing protein RIC7-like [Senna tora]
MADSEKEQEMQIGLPTDVKHVAHIGWDGPSVNTPSWMNEFKATTTPYSSAPLSQNGSMDNAEAGNAVKWVSQEIDSRRQSRRETSEMPKSSRRQSAGNGTDSPVREKSRQTRRSSKQRDPSEASKPTETIAIQGSESPAGDLPDIPKKTRRKKSKENSGGGSGGAGKSRLKKSSSDQNTDSVGSEFKPSKERSHREEDGQGESENGSSEDVLRNLV